MWSAIKAVLWSFFGIRKQTDYDQDEKKLKVVHVVIAGIVCCVLLILSLFFLVRMIAK